jgi:hypothetical protein
MLALAAIWKFLKSIPLWVYAILLAVVVGAFFINAYGDRRYEAGQAHTQAVFDAFKADLEAKRQQAIEEANKVEADLAEQDRADLEELRRKNRETVAERDRIIADIRADNLRLQERFRHQAASGVSAGTGSGTGANGTRECGLRKSDEEDFIRLAADADAVVNKLTTCQAKLQSIQDSQNGRDN